MNIYALRKTILNQYSSELVFRKYPLQLLFGLLWIALILTVIYCNLHFEIPLFLKILSSLVLGMAFTALSFFNHELLHGSIVKEGVLLRFLAYPGFFILAVSPELWLTWHNYVHHFHTNEVGGSDPDLASEWERLKKKKIGLVITRILPGSGHWLSYLMMPFLFGLQSLNVMWIRSLERPELYKAVRRPLVIAETLMYLTAWGCIIYLMPFWSLFYLLIIPGFIVNIVVINYVGLPHHLRPLVRENLPFFTTYSLKAPKIIDLLTFNFSHHVEHHIFPEMSHSQFPAMRKHLRKQFPEDYLFVKLGTALKTFYSTPRAYADETNLYYAETGKTVDLFEIEKKIICRNEN
jgi:fatty acid desaturase